MSQPSDGSGGDSGKPDDPDDNAAAAKPAVSDAVAHEVDGGPSKVQAQNDEPAVRPSSLDLLSGKMTYPDDGPFARALRKFDRYIGTFEQALLVFFMAALVLMTASMAIADKVAEYRPHIKDDVIRACTFGLAMIGGAFASHQAKHLAMDLVSRRLSPRPRLFLRVFLALFTAFMVILFIRAGLRNVEQEATMREDPKLISNARLAWLIPLGGGLMLVHTIIHMIIDCDYIARRKSPPERMRSH